MTSYAGKSGFLPGGRALLSGAVMLSCLGLSLLLLLLSSLNPSAAGPGWVAAVAGILAGLYAFIRHGYGEVTVLGLFSLAVAMFEGVAGSYA
ncbi:hypothetical protein, partial [Sediminivirga luteola]